MSRDGSPQDRGTSRTQNLSRQKEGGANALSGARDDRSNLFVPATRDHYSTTPGGRIFLVVEQEEDSEACADLMAVIEKIQEVILKIAGPL
jgi:hypothetical protein